MNNTSIIIGSLAEGENLDGFEHVWIPDGGELISEIFMMLERLKAPPFAVQYMGFDSDYPDRLCVRISERGNYCDISIDAPNVRRKKHQYKQRNTIWYNGKEVTKLNVKKTKKGAFFSGRIILPNGRGCEITYNWYIGTEHTQSNIESSTLQSIVFTNQDGLQVQLNDISLKKSDTRP